MRLMEILLLMMTVLVFLLGLVVFIGSPKDAKRTSIWFFIATIGMAIWAGSITVFLTLSSNEYEIAKILIDGIYGGAILMGVGLLFYFGRQYSAGRFFAILFSIVGVVLIGLLIVKPELLYSGIDLNYADGNMINIRMDWYYLVYMTYFVLVALILFGELLVQIVESEGRKQRVGQAIILVGLLAMGVLSLIFDVVLPLKRYDLVWVGPLAISCVALAFYYAILRYRLIDLSARSLKVLSYIMLIVFGTVVYMLLFYTVVTVLFKELNPSTSFVMLNFVMVIIMLLMIPVINELGIFVKTLISTRDVNIARVVKRLNKLASENIELDDLAKFLADSLHYEYVGLVVDGQLFGSDRLIEIKNKDLQEIAKMKSVGKNIWQEPKDKVLKEIFKRSNINAVAELCDAKGKEFGQILIGKACGHNDYDRKDLMQVEMIINLVAAVVESKKQVEQ